MLACEGRMIRAIEHSRVTMTMEVESAPTVLHISERNDIKHVLFGTVDGRVGLLDIERFYSNESIQSQVQNCTTNPTKLQDTRIQ